MYRGIVIPAGIYYIHTLTSRGGLRNILTSRQLTLLTLKTNFSLEKHFTLHKKRLLHNLHVKCLTSKQCNEFILPTF